MLDPLLSCFLPNMLSCFPFLVIRLAVGFREEVTLRSPCYPSPHHDGASPGIDGGAADLLPVSPPLLPALALLEQRLALLADRLDAPSFRDIWRAGERRGGRGLRGSIF